MEFGICVFTQYQVTHFFHVNTSTPLVHKFVKNEGFILFTFGSTKFSYTGLNKILLNELTLCV